MTELSRDALEIYEAPVGRTYLVYGRDCCLGVSFVARLDHYTHADEIDVLDGEELGTGRSYWSNGVVLEGGAVVEEVLP